MAAATLPAPEPAESDGAKSTAKAPGGAAKSKLSETAWREAWVGAPFAGTVDIAPDAATGEEHLIIRCREVLTKYGVEAIIVDDGRTVGVGLEDMVAFGVVPRPGKAPMAVNVYRMPQKRRKTAAGAFEAEPVNALPASLAGDLRGVIRNQQLRTGDYWIDCDEVHRHYQRNAKIRVDQMPEGATIGDPIIFSIDPPFSDISAPLAKNVVLATGEAAEAILAKAAQGKGRKGKGKGGWKGSQWGAAPRVDPSTVMRMIGVVKKKLPSSGRHLILCQDISDVYGRDAQIPPEEEPEGGLKIGDRIAFDVDEPRNGQLGLPLARHVRVIDRAGVKRKAAPGGGDGEDQDEDEPIDPGDGEDEDLVDADNVAEEPVLDEKDMEEAAEQERLEGGGRAAAATSAAPRAPSAKASPREPTTPEEWQDLQEEMFPGMPPLPPGWIRIRSKSKGLVYFYNMVTGASSAKEPRLA